jgi:hypothetical protein
MAEQNKGEEKKVREGNVGEPVVIPVGIPTGEPVDVAWQERNNPHFAQAAMPPSVTIHFYTEDGELVESLAGFEAEAVEEEGASAPKEENKPADPPKEANKPAERSQGNGGKK